MKKAFIFDFDDTLATTDARVIVRREPTDRVICKLTPKEYNNYVLGEDQFFDFSQFRCPEILIKGKPTFFANLAKEVSDEQQDVFILTARSGNVEGIIQSWLDKHDINAKMIFCVGDEAGNKNIPAEKRKIILTIIEAYDKIYFYDDCNNNINEAPNSSKLRKYRV